jgi:uncharacterized membrane protein
MRFGRLIYFLALLICVFEIVRLWSITPPEMAAHFNVQGIPDRFVAKTEFFWFQVQTLAVVVGVSLLPQVLILLLPASLINMPHREYWLAPERRDDTLNRLSSFGAVMFAVILLAVQAAFELAAYANLQTPIRYNAQWMFLFMIGSIILIGLALLQLAVSFRLPND